MKKLFRKERALLCALFPIPYILVSLLLSALTSALNRYLGWEGLLWQCMGALSLTLFVLGPMFIIISDVACIYYAARELRSRSSVRKNTLLILIALATIVLSVIWFRLYWYVR